MAQEDPIENIIEKRSSTSKLQSLTSRDTGDDDDDDDYDENDPHIFIFPICDKHPNGGKHIEYCSFCDKKLKFCSICISNSHDNSNNSNSNSNCNDIINDDDSPILCEKCKLLNCHHCGKIFFSDLTSYDNIFDKIEYCHKCNKAYCKYSEENGCLIDMGYNPNTTITEHEASEYLVCISCLQGGIIKMSNNCTNEWIKYKEKYNIKNDNNCKKLCQFLKESRNNGKNYNVTISYTDENGISMKGIL